LTVDDTNAAALWIRFAAEIAPDAQCPMTPVGGWASHNRSDLDEWIDTVVECLCQRHQLCSALLAAGPEAFS